MWGDQVLLVNAYVLYRSTHTLMWKTNKKNSMNQYEFRRSIALEWIGGNDPGGNRSSTTFRKRKSDDISRSSSNCEMSTNATEPKAQRVTDNSLDPIGGALRCRLDESLFHYPELIEKGRPCCSLCR